MSAEKAYVIVINRYNGEICMESLFETYSGQKESYYRTICDAANLFVDDWKNSKEKCLGFMDGHYRKGEKEGLFSTDLLEQYRQHGKHVHSTSLYLLGKSVLPLFQEKLDCALKPFLPNYEHWHDGGHDYWHIWYLTSMYHDFASCIELGTIHVNDSEGHRSLRFHLGNHNIRYILYGSFPYKLYDIPFRFSPELINNYFYYRACHGMCDHGIIAGYLFFDRFIKNFLGKTGPEPSDKFDENGNMERNVLNWNTDFPMYAAYVADAIICHNVWLGGEAEKATYMQYGLTPLLHRIHVESSSPKRNLHSVGLRQKYFPFCCAKYDTVYCRFSQKRRKKQNRTIIALCGSAFMLKKLNVRLVLL